MGETAEIIDDIIATAEKCKEEANEYFKSERVPYIYKNNIYYLFKTN